MDDGQKKYYIARIFLLEEHKARIYSINSKEKAAMRKMQNTHSLMIVFSSLFFVFYFCSPYYLSWTLLTKNRELIYTRDFVTNFDNLPLLFVYNYDDSILSHERSKINFLLQ